MKISKLFHWLYALVMLLPMFAIGVTCITTFWNKEITADNEVAQIQYKYETNEVNSNNDLIPNRIYKLSIPERYAEQTIFCECYGIYNVEDYRDFEIDYTSDTNYFRVWQSANTNIYISLYRNGTWDNIYNILGNNITYPFEMDIVYRTSTYNYNNFSNSTFLQIENVEITTEPTEFDTKNVFYYAVDKVTESPLFSWSYNSFLVAPFSYIVALFGMPTNHVVVELLSYWLAISIIWLVFDLVMYVPLLVHRWLDKGVLE